MSCGTSRWDRPYTNQVLKKKNEVFLALTKFPASHADPGKPLTRHTNFARLGGQYMGAVWWFLEDRAARRDRHVVGCVTTSKAPRCEEDIASDYLSGDVVLEIEHHMV